MPTTQTDRETFVLTIINHVSQGTGEERPLTRELLEGGRNEPTPSQTPLLQNEEPLVHNQPKTAQIGHTDRLMISEDTQDQCTPNRPILLTKQQYDLTLN
jgi:hypothetical protein